MSKIVAIYGSPGSGKSMLAAALGAQLAAQKQNVIVLSTSRVVPMLKVLVPSQTVGKQYSVGGLFLSPTISQEDVCKRIVFHPKSDNLGFMGFSTGDTQNTYSGVFTPDKMQSLYNILLSLIDILVVDCTALLSPAADPLGNVALFNAANAIKVLTPDILGLEYNTAIVPLLRETAAENPHIGVLGRCAPTSPVAQIREVSEELFPYSLTLSAEAADFFLSGRLLTGLKTREGIAYRKEVENLAQEVMKTE